MSVRSIGFEDRIVGLGKNTIVLGDMQDDSELRVRDGTIRVRANGIESKITEQVRGLFSQRAGFRVESTEGMKVGDRIWVNFSFTRTN